MKSLWKYVVGVTYKPLLGYYLSFTRTYSYQNIRLQVPSNVFHPGFFFSTKLLLRYLSNIPMAGKLFLELGAGSGLISIVAAQKGATVTASDINKTAIRTLKKNAQDNGVKISVLESDVFQSISRKCFDLIAINPPYYKKQPISVKEYAWYCGEKGEFFQQLFSGLDHFIHSQSEVYMILCDDCDLDMISRYANEHLFKMNCVATFSNLLEKNFIFKIEKVDA